MTPPASAPVAPSPRICGWGASPAAAAASPAPSEAKQDGGGAGGAGAGAGGGGGIDPGHVQTLISMGVPRPKAEAALRNHPGDFYAALCEATS